MGHLRAASNPRGLPHGRLLGVVNNQPFSHENLLFAHNGTLNIPDEVAKNLGPHARKIRGLNDSEIYFWQWVKFLDLTRSAPRALAACIHETWRIWRTCRDRYPRFRTPYTGLNTIVSDGKALHALCHYPYGTEGVHGLCNPTQPWGLMSWARRSGRVLVASENLDGGSWTRLQDGELLSVQAEGGRLRVRSVRLPLEELRGKDQKERVAA